MASIYKMSSAGGMTSDTRYPNMLTNYGDFGAMQRIATFAPNGSEYVNFYNIPQTFQDLRIVVYGRSNNAVTSESMSIFLTSSFVASGLYSLTNLNGNGSSATSTRNTNQDNISTIGVISGASATSGIFGATTIDILNYANTSTFKTAIARSACDLNGSGNTILTVGLWRSTSAVSALAIYPAGGSQQFAAGTRISLYGIKASAA